MSLFCLPRALRTRTLQLMAPLALAASTALVASPAAVAADKSKAAAPAKAADPAKKLLGSYLCTFKDGDVTYKAQPCKITRSKGEDGQPALRFAKSGGSQRFDGLVTPTDGGFAFAGKFFCPRGACDAPLDNVAFTGNRRDGFVGTLPLQHGPVEVKMRLLGMKRK